MVWTWVEIGVLRLLRLSPVPLNRLRRWAIILGLFVASPVVGRIMVRGGKLPQLLLGGLGGLVGGLILYRLGRMEYGILAIAATAGFVRFKLPTGTQSEIVASLLVSLLILGVWVAKMLLVEKRLTIKPAPTNRPLLSFMAVCVIAYVWSNAFRDPLVKSWGSFPMVQLASLAVMLALPGVYLLVSNYVEEIGWLKVLAWIILVIGAGAIVSYKWGLPTKRIFGTGGIFPTWFIALAYAFVLFDETLNWKVRLGLVGFMALWIYWVFFKGLLWMSGWVPAFTAMGVITLLRSRKLTVLAGIAVLAYLAINYEYYYEKVIVASEEEGDYQRLELWKTNLDLVSKHPLLGTGPAGYAVYYMTYHPENARSTHNNYFDIIAQTGVIGISLYLWFFASLAWAGYKLFRVLRYQRDFEVAFAAGTLGGTVGAILSGMLGDWVIPFAYNQTIRGFDHSVYSWLLMGGMMALYRMKVGKDGGEAHCLIQPKGV